MEETTESSKTNRLLVCVSLPIGLTSLELIEFHFLDGLSIAQPMSRSVTKKLTFSDIWTSLFGSSKSTANSTAAAAKTTVRSRNPGGIPGGAWILAGILSVWDVYKTLKPEPECRSPYRRHGTGTSSAADLPVCRQLMRRPSCRMSFPGAGRNQRDSSSHRRARIQRPE